MGRRTGVVAGSGKDQEWSESEGGGGSSARAWGVSEGSERGEAEEQETRRAFFVRFFYTNETEGGRFHCVPYIDRSTVGS